MSLLCDISCGDAVLMDGSLSKGGWGGGRSQCVTPKVMTSSDRVLLKFTFSE